MKKSFKVAVCILLIIAAVSSCKKVEQGFLSSQIRYVDNPIKITRGQIVQTAAVNGDGSSAPVIYTLLDIRDSTHHHADSLYKNFERYEWIGQFDANTDTTVELLNKKRAKKNTPPFEFNEHTGAFTFYGTTTKVPLGTYEFDIKATNQNGSKVFNNVATFTLVDGVPYQIGAGGCAWFIDGTTTSGDLGAPDVWIEKTSDEGTDITLKIVDQNNNPFNPAANEIIRRGDRSDFQTYAQFHPLVKTDSTMTCNYETTPFPLKQSQYGYLIYYRIPSQFVNVDPAFTPDTKKIYSVNPRFQFNIYQEGSYSVTVKMKHVTRVMP
ncbi:protein of unknown function [Chitinophaga sp. CF118]|uniref:DUF5007 domain-containing protein n=1 Tax=Chitinophaga sp. CF118 TaxID=1884367 RepID=UPI0008F2017A|nr:DUF5007 domain-containing protein [Chitinophaga sp. CF118]SFE01329.1 protein of unknown function [Chitinophaga sp. CF118]